MAVDFAIMAGERRAMLATLDPARICSTWATIQVISV
jgi:hypothetical protein